MGITDDQKLYIQRIIKARESAGLKQDEICIKIGVSRPTYSNYERDRAMPQKYIAQFCKVTGVSEKWLLTGSGAMKNQYTDWESERFDFIKGLEETDRKRYDEAMRLIFPEKFKD